MNKKLLLEEKFLKGCLMLELSKGSLSKIWNKVQSIIVEEDIYNDESKKFGREIEPHVTVLFGFDNGTDTNKIKKFANNSDILLNIVKVGVFENEKFDVLKFEIESNDLIALNKTLTDNFEYTNDYDGYNPHITIAYLKKGTGKKYIGNIKSVTIKGGEFKYSDAHCKDGIFW